MSPKDICQLERSTVLTYIGAELGIASSITLIDRNKIYIIAEYLRESLYKLSLDTKRKSFNPVYVTRLTNTVQKSLASLFVQSVEDEGRLLQNIHQTLDILAKIGDIIQLSRGYYLPAPIRFVAIPQNKEVALFIGGISTKQVKQQRSLNVNFSGLIRVVKVKDLPAIIVNNDELWQDFLEWVDIPTNQGLQQWTLDYFSNSQHNLQNSGANSDDYEIYLPSLTKTNFQYHRWVDLRPFSGSTASLFLCRTQKTPFQYKRSYIFARLQQSGTEITIKKECDVTYEHVKRLQYGIDLIEKRPTRVLLNKQPAMHIFQVSNGLPAAELRLISALTQDLSPYPGSFPLVIGANPAISLTIRECFEKLGIVIEEGLGVENVE